VRIARSEMICGPDDPKAITPHWGHGVHSRDPINCVLACDATQVNLVAGPVLGPGMANGRPCRWLFGLLGGSATLALVFSRRGIILGEGNVRRWPRRSVRSQDPRINVGPLG